MSSDFNIQVIWNNVTEEVKQKVIRPTLWRSMEIAAPITIDEGQFVVGFPPGSFHMSGNLTTGDHKNAIETALHKFTRQPLTLRIIEGDSLPDWEHVKYKDMHAELLREEAQKKREKERSATQSWDGLMEQIGRKYSSIPLRQLPQVRASFASEMLQVISTVIDDLMPEGSQVDELAERNLARAIEKVAQLADLSPTYIAFELHRLREKR